MIDKHIIQIHCRLEIRFQTRQGNMSLSVNTHFYKSGKDTTLPPKNQKLNGSKGQVNYYMNTRDRQN